MAESIPISEPYYVILFHTSMVQRPYVPTVSILETAFQYRQGKVTLPLGLDKSFIPTLPCLWYCLQLPRTRFDLVRVPMKGRKEAERFHFPHRIVLFPVPWHASFIPQLNNPWPKLIITPDDLLEAAQDLAQRLDHVLDVTPASALNIHTL